MGVWTLQHDDNMLRILEAHKFNRSSKPCMENQNNGVSFFTKKFNNKYCLLFNKWTHQCYQCHTRATRLFERCNGDWFIGNIISYLKMRPARAVSNDHRHAWSLGTEFYLIKPTSLYQTKFQTDRAWRMIVPVGCTENKISIKLWFKMMEPRALYFSQGANKTTSRMEHERSLTFSKWNLTIIKHSPTLYSIVISSWSK